MISIPARNMTAAILQSIVSHPWRLAIDRGQYVSHLGALRLVLLGETETPLGLWPYTYAPANLFTDMSALPATVVATNQHAVFDHFDAHLQQKKIAVTLSESVETILEKFAVSLAKPAINTTLLQHVAATVGVILQVTEQSGFTISSRRWQLVDIFSSDQLDAAVHGVRLHVA